ncbi:hypothetical protein CNYM01_09688 [Colletotrichum nymphaeae SA-01]|uniref:Spherulin-4 n=1 Tax=Colletotrichum nymphaeae SA-01 TaxID=1460502 RepID=A0A135T9M9_9PEZI|nr:hypothetical protein CNYM01_09688 [Colletotrichum nymphaeae SA-01]
MRYSLEAIFTFVLLGSTTASSGPLRLPQITYPSNVGCGEVNVFYTGLPAYHPYVIAQHYGPVDVDKELRNDTAALVKAGFNVYVLFQGPDQPITNIADRMNGTHWGVTGVGFGQRGATILDVVTRFEGIYFYNLHQFRENAPLTPTVFNWGPTTLAASVIRHVPLKEDCLNKPGKLIAYEEVCPPELCEKVTVVTSGSLEELLKGIEH